MRYFVGNLPYQSKKQDLIDTFAEYGYVATDVDMVSDKLTGRFRGYGFADLDAVPSGEIIIGIRRLHINKLER